MRLFKFFLTLLFTLVLIYTLNNGWNIKGTPIPPLGKFLDPFHGFWQNAEDSALPYPESVELNGLSAPVTVQYDSLYIPHIFAQNTNDLFTAQGYVLAQHRLWQMEFQTYAASGRISELIGSAAVDFDKLQRRKGMVYGAEKSLNSMQENTELWAYVTNYAKGVNQYIEELSYKDYPLEYKLLNYEPEEWTPLKSALLLQYMIDNLTGWDMDLENTNAYNLFGAEIFKKLYPNYTATMDPIAPSAQNWEFEGVEVTETPDSINLSNNYYSEVHTMPDPDNGSNNWVVSGWKTESGKPILASDMHLGLNLPSLWFLIELSAPDYNTMGFALAGNVGIVSGFNQNNAWAFTDVSRDERDWYHIRFTDESRKEYYYEDTKLKTSLKVEEIKVKGSETIIDSVIYTHHGPVVYDRNFMSEDGENNLALKWIGHYPSRVQEALLGLNTSKSYQDYLTALEYWDAPAQHVAFASTSGDIAIRVQGLWPNKFEDQGRFILDGSQKVMEWQEFIPTNHYAFLHNPDRGFVSSANQHSVDSIYPYWQGWARPDHYRGRRINKILAAYDSGTIKPDDMMQLQLDSYGILSQEILPTLLDSLKKNGLNSDTTYMALRNWDYVYDHQEYAPVAFISWWSNFKSLLWDEMKIDSIAIKQPTDYQTIYLVKNGIPGSFEDNKATSRKETLNDIIAMSYDSMKMSLAQWSESNTGKLTWGNYKHTAVTHLARIPAFSRRNIQVNGEDDVVNSTKGNHGPSQRIVVEMTSPPQAWAVIPGGQSGNPGNPAYDNMLDAWRDGKFFKLNFMQNQKSAQDVLLNQTLAPSAE
ncbi:penicillin acylase family protein [Fulvivirga sp. RKSG066]|uniref:penicillin acylase family protein n=1 Tax=Fulvivirga aurantia TaxID=2529383 RepID=UPI0012BC8B01|nr:penicillin acylase family protein [Fulvivirga aurantia]MTI21019.1 penicillin acylase family protein [Fulvivirga aurantia]